MSLRKAELSSQKSMTSIARFSVGRGCGTTKSRLNHVFSLESRTHIFFNVLPIIHILTLINDEWREYFVSVCSHEKQQYQWMEMENNSQRIFLLRLCRVLSTWCFFRISSQFWSWFSLSIRYKCVKNWKVFGTKLQVCQCCLRLIH